VHADDVTRQLELTALPPSQRGRALWNDLKQIHDDARSRHYVDATANLQVLIFQTIYC
jgi:hypothetical protein